MSKKNHKASAEMLWHLAENVKRMRKARGWSQKTLQHVCGFPQGYISKIEQELLNVSLANLERLANGLNCSLYDLFAPLKKDRPDNEEP